MAMCVLLTDWNHLAVVCCTWLVLESLLAPRILYVPIGFIKSCCFMCSARGLDLWVGGEKMVRVVRRKVRML